MPLGRLIRTVVRALRTMRLCTIDTVMLSAVRALARIGMLGAVVGMRGGATLVTWVPAIHANVIGGGMGPR
jgi:hypothetical protein